MKTLKYYSLGLVFVIVVKLASAQIPGGCPVADDPSNLARCIQVDISAIVSAVRGSNDFTAFCALASRYMECFKTYTRGCVGGFIGEGTFNELINTAYYCCNGVTSSTGCPFNPNVNRRCIDGDANAIMSDGSYKKIKSLEIGDKVKTLDHYGNLIDTDVIMMLDFQNNNEEYLFLNITTESKKSVKVSVEHLMAISNDEFKLARFLNRGDSIVTYDHEKKVKTIEKIVSILIEPVMSYAAPLTLEGTILADGVLASSYAVIESHTLAHMGMAPLRWWYQFYNMINQATPNVLPSNFQFEKQLNGTHWYPLMLHSFGQQYLTSIVKL